MTAIVWDVAAINRRMKELRGEIANGAHWRMNWSTGEMALIEDGHDWTHHGICSRCLFSWESLRDNIAPKRCPGHPPAPGTVLSTWRGHFGGHYRLVVERVERGNLVLRQEEA